MSRNRTQRYADFLIDEARTFQEESEYSVEEMIQGDGEHGERIVEKSKEMQNDVPMKAEQLRTIAVERWNQHQSPYRDGGYVEANER